MQRVLVNTATTIYGEFTVGGVATDTDDTTATVSIASADGSVTVAPIAAAHVGTGLFGYGLNQSHTALTNVLTATWAGTVNGAAQQITTRVEVVGGFLCTMADLRADTDLADTTKYPAEKLQEARTWAEDMFERETGVAWVPRYAEQTFDGDPFYQLRFPQVRTIRHAIADGVPLGTADLANLTVRGGKLVTTSGGLSPCRYDRQRLVVGYEHGYDYPPGPVSDAVRIATKDHAIQGPFSDRRLALPTEDGGTIGLAIPGNRGAFGLPAVDAVAASYDHRVPVG